MKSIFYVNFSKCEPKQLYHEQRTTPINFSMGNITLICKLIKIFIITTRMNYLGNNNNVYHHGPFLLKSMKLPAIIKIKLALPV